MEIALELGLAIAAFVFTITKSRIFRGLRVGLWLRWQWAGKLFSCPYCLSHWVSAIITPFCWRGAGPLETGIHIFVVIAIAAGASGVIAWAHEHYPTAEWVLLEEGKR